MRKYIMLFCTLNYFGVSVWKVYYAYAPRVGPIGNGPNEEKVWIEFIFSMMASLAFAVWTIKMFIQDKKNRNKKEEK